MRFVLYREPARYLDPVTQLPYCNIPTFRILREAYYQQLESKGDRNKPEVAEWLAFRQSGRERAAQTVRVDPSLIQITKVHLTLGYIEHNKNTYVKEVKLGKYTMLTFN